MKKILLFLISFISFSAIAQVNEKVHPLNGEEKNSFSIFLPKTEKKVVEKAWSRFMKTYKGKTKLNKKTGVAFSDDIKIEGMSNNTVDVYAQVIESGTDTELIVWYDLGGAYLNSAMHPEGISVGRSLLTDFTLTVSKEAIEELLAVEEASLKELTKAQEKLEKEQEAYEAEIKKCEEKIKEARINIEKNAKAQISQKEKVSQQEQVVNEVKEKLKKVE
ncbi:MAG: hypothetical protein AAFO82_15685 [Bacteroidota bacterium]